VRGFGGSVAAVPTPSPAGWLLTGAHRPETSVLRGAVCDYVRATQVAAAGRADAAGGQPRRWLPLMAEAVAPQADLLVLGVPSFGWVEGRRLLVERGSGAEVAAFLERHPQYPEQDLGTVLSYFDAALLAPAVKCPTVVGLGLVDRLQSRVEVMTLSESHTDGAAMRAWDRFDERWLGLALSGIPPGFGRQRRAAASFTQAR
jgi:cephalosporin-C deacetylase